MAGCATSSDVQSLRNDLATMRTESLNQKKEIAQVKERLSEVTKDVNTLTAIRESQSSLLTQSSDFSKELQVLKGRFDENKYFMDRTTKDLLSERDLQQARMTALENEVKELKRTGGAVAEKKESLPPPDSGKEAKAEAKPSEGSLPGDPQRMYDDGQIDLKEKRYGQARQKFERLIKDFPKHALVPNSYFWTGESYYAEKKYEDAILSYETLIKTFPHHDKARAAMLKQGYSFIEMGDKKTGKVILERLIEKYPRSNEAELAEKKIAELLSKSNGKNKATPKKRKQ